MAAKWMELETNVTKKWAYATEMAWGRHMASIWRPYGVHMAGKKWIGDTKNSV